MVNHLTIGSQNVGRSQAASSILTSDLGKYDIVCYQEPLLTKRGRIVGVPGKFSLIQHKTPKTGIAVVNTTLQAAQVLAKENLAAIVIDTPSTQILVASIYLSPNEDIDPGLEELQALLDKHQKGSVVVLGDFNSKHELWGQQRADERGNKLLEFIVQNRLNICNHPESPPTFQSSRGTSWIDLALVRLEQGTALEDWYLDPLDSGTEHLRMAVEISLKRERVIPNSKIRLKDLDLNGFRDKLKAKLGSLSEGWVDGQTIDVCVDEVSEVIREAAQASLRVKRPRPHAVPWWTQELSILRKRVSAFRRRFQRCSWDENLREQRKADFKRERATFKKEVQHAKWAYWRRSLSEVTLHRPFTSHFKWARGKCTQRLRIETIKRTDGTETSGFRDTILALMDHHFPQDKWEEDTETQAQVRSYVPELGEDDPPFTLGELEQVFRSLNRGRAPGLDGIPLELVEVAFETNKRLFLHIANSCLARGVFPSRWKVASLVLFNKEGKDGKDPSSYRPICLLPAWSKVLDRLVVNRLLYHLMSRGLMAPNQFGFIPGRGTEDAIAAVYETVKAHWSNGLCTCLISLDVKSAFNNAWWPAILYNIGRTGCPRNVYELVKSFLGNRKVVYQTVAERLEHCYSKGCPQGSNSGPLYWNVIANTALNLDLGEGVLIQAYADDFVILVGGENAHQCGLRAQVALGRLEEWSRECKLQFAPQKTVGVFFQRVVRAGRRRTPRTPPRLHFMGAPVHFRDSVKYLGVYIDQKLSGLEHVSYVRSQIQTFIYGLSSLRGTGWGLNGPVLKALYKRGLERMVTYACGAWWSGSVRQKKALVQAQRLALIALTGCYRTTATSAIQVLAGVLPLDLQVEYEAYISRLRSKRDPIRVELSLVSPGTVEQPLERWRHHPARSPHIKWGPGSQTNIGIEVFTDGSKISEKVGAAYAIYQDGEYVRSDAFRLSDHATVFQAEVQAVIEALGATLEFPEITILSDSQATLKALERLENTNPMIEMVHVQSRDRVVRWKWVKAHIGVPGNEKADSLAKEGASLEEVSVPVERSIASVKTQLKLEAFSLWQKRWAEETTGRSVYKFLPRVSIHRMWQTRRVNWVITGHGPFPAYFRRFRLKESRNCNYCGLDRPADGIHIVASCPGTRDKRYKYCRNLQINTLGNYFRCAQGRAAIERLLWSLRETLD